MFLWIRTVSPRRKQLTVVTGAFFGAWGCGFCDPLGRRGALALGSVLFLVGGILQTAAEAVAMLYVGRLVAGFGIGILVMIVPIFQAEISHANIRGILISLQQTMLGIGALSASWIGMVALLILFQPLI